MVLTFHSAVINPPQTLIMGANKHENYIFIAPSTKQVVIFHVDDLPSADMYPKIRTLLEITRRTRRLIAGVQDVPAALLQDTDQLCKTDRNQGDKLSNVAVILYAGIKLTQAKANKDRRGGHHQREGRGKGGGKKRD